MQINNNINIAKIQPSLVLTIIFTRRIGKFLYFSSGKKIGIIKAITAQIAIIISDISLKTIIQFLLHFQPQNQ